MTEPRNALEDAAQRLQFRVGVWIRGEPHLSAQLDWARRPVDAPGGFAVERLLAAHRRVSEGWGGQLAQKQQRALAHALDPRRTAARSTMADLDPYLATLVALA